jgi:hypothetical protein
VSDDRVPAPVEALVRAIAGGARDDDDQRATTFARGLALGALVGAAIAGSTLWQRRHARQDRATVAEATRDEAAHAEAAPDGADRPTRT